MKIINRKIDEIRKFDRNSRVHTDEQVRQVAESIREFGWTNPILVDCDGTVVAGHARLEAARSLGLTEVPTICLDHLTPAQVRAYVIADNRLAMNASWDNAILRDEIQFLLDQDFNVELTGFDMPDIDEILSAVEDKAPARERKRRDATELPSGMWEIVVSCDDEAHQERLYQELVAMGLKVRVLGC